MQEITSKIAFVPLLRKDQRRFCRSTTVAVGFVVIALSLCSGRSTAESCRYRMWPQMSEFTREMVTPPDSNSVCIYPDGRTSLSDATKGAIEVMFYRVEHRGDSGTWAPISVPGQGLFLSSGNNSNLAVCGNVAPVVEVDYSGGVPVYFGQQPIYGGGHSPTDSAGHPIDGAAMYWAPSDCGWVPLPIYFNSPDINGDGAVNISDIPLFSQDYNGVYNFRSDFDFDGDVDLADFGIFVGGLGSTCSGN